MSSLHFWIRERNTSSFCKSSATLAKKTAGIGFRNQLSKNHWSLPGWRLISIHRCKDFCPWNGYFKRELCKPGTWRTVTLFNTCPMSVNDIRKATNEDEVLINDIKFALTKWSQSTSKGEMLELCQRLNNIVVVCSYLILSDRVFIPGILRNSALTQFHSGHLGINSTKSIPGS